MRIDVFTIFPDMVDGFASRSLMGKARERGVIDVRIHDLRSGANDPHRSVDAAPFGGGAGMVLMPEPLFRAVESVEHPRPLFLLGPGGRRLDQSVARELASLDGFSLLCGRYEGVDARVDFAGMTAYTGKFMQVRVREKVTGHMVGLYRFPAVPEEKFTALLPGVVEVDEVVRVESVAAVEVLVGVGEGGRHVGHGAERRPWRKRPSRWPGVSLRITR